MACACDDGNAQQIDRQDDYAADKDISHLLLRTSRCCQHDAGECHHLS